MESCCKFSFDASLYISDAQVRFDRFYKLFELKIEAATISGPTNACKKVVLFKIKLSEICFREIQDLSGSWCIKGTDESVTRVDSSVPLMHNDPDRSWINDPDPDHPKGTHP